MELVRPILFGIGRMPETAAAAAKPASPPGGSRVLPANTAAPLGLYTVLPSLWQGPPLGSLTAAPDARRRSPHGAPPIELLTALQQRVESVSLVTEAHFLMPGKRVA
ncbi:hypothetical protein NDU88_002443 [Pleurodeles waltl]|uniref:Uncharacterized protein n=1 Tax=Pleurodeles waltl TaxID=8319 RepID=A0AAV7VAJ8_PLEWA|nr:hypothetical protein NDU88_002443 [Pleurodeles waltl]